MTALGGVSTRELSLSSLNTIFPWIAGLTGNEQVTEIMVVCSRSGSVHVFYEEGGKLHRIDARGADSRAVERLCFACSRPLGADPVHTPLIDARLEDGSRVAVCVPPAAEAPAVTIRRFRKVVITAAELVRMGSLPQAVLDAMGAVLAEGGNVLVAGGTGSGKTTLLNALIKMFPRNHRIVVIEDTIELRVEQLNTVRLEARQLKQYDLSIRDMVRHALRQRPDHIVVGEIRGAEAQDVLQALNTGHGGSLTTIHANTAWDALSRMVACAAQAEDRLPWDVLCHSVASAFALVVHQARRPDGSRGVSELVRVDGYDSRSCEWKVSRLWSHRRPKAPAFTPVRPPVAVARVDGRAVAVRPGSGRVVPVDLSDPETLAPPGVPGLPSRSVIAMWPPRPLASLESVSVRPPADAVPVVVVTYPDGLPVRVDPGAPPGSDVPVAPGGAAFDPRSAPPPSTV